MRKAFPLVLLLVLGAGSFLGLPQSAAADDDPPGRVARLNYIHGSVSFQPSGEQDWVEADLHRPLTTGDNLWADKDSRGEVHIGSTAIRLSSETGISFLNIDDRTVQIQLAQGTIEVHLRRLDAGDAYEIDTPNLAFTLIRPGEYRIETDPSGSSTIIIVREGEGEVTGAGESWDLVPGERYEFDGTDELGYYTQPAPGMDDFEDWCQARDQRENSSASARYVSRDVDGYYDLDDYGNWQIDPVYGAIWFPGGVAAGWVPYHFGHWVWIAPWGWTWVGEEPWGYAPYHYGRWAFVGGYWGWVPGPIVVRPFYAPHLVAFVGGGGVSVAMGFGAGFTGVAWFPLGPRDVWIPAYRASPRYVQTINITNTRVVNVTQVTNVYNTTIVNRSVAGNNYMYANQPAAVTAVRKEDFINARPVGQVAVKVSAEQIQNARPVETAGLAPTRNSYIAATAKPAAPSAKPKVPFADRKVVAKMNPPIPPSGGHESAITNAEKPARTAEKPPAAENKEAESTAHGNAAPSPAESRAVAPSSRATNEPQQHPAVKFSPPVRAKEENYDVHPPLNNKPAPPKTEQKRAEPPPKAEERPSTSKPR